MKVKMVGALATAASVLVFSGLLFAHHGAALYALNEEVNVTGIVTEFRFTNPHARISFNVTGQDGKVIKWVAEMTTPTRLSEVDGWHRDTLKPGDQITIMGSPAKDGTPALWVEQVFMDEQPLLVIPGGPG